MPQPESVAEATGSLRARADVTPGLAVVLVGENPASQVYVRSKSKQAKEAGINAIDKALRARGRFNVSIAIPSLVWRSSTDSSCWSFIVFSCLSSGWRRSAPDPDPT